jgi:hypothetical protein
MLGSMFTTAVGMALSMWVALQAPATAEPTAAAEPVSGPEPEVRHDQGPLGLDLLVLYEQRFRFFEQLPGNIPSSEIQMRFRLRGEGIGEVVRFGNVVFDEVLDNLGESLLREEDQTDQYRDFLRPTNAAPGALEANGMPLPARIKSPKRNAAVLRSMKGTVRVIRAAEREQIVIIEPLELVGKQIQHPRLAELGIELTLMPIGNPTGYENPAQALVLRLDKGGEKLSRLEFCDEWLRTIAARPPAQRTTNEGDACLVYQAARRPFDQNTQMIIEVFPDAKDERIPFLLKDVQLP